MPISEPELEIARRVDRSRGGTQQAKMTLIDELTEPCMRPMTSRSTIRTMKLILAAMGVSTVRADATNMETRMTSLEPMRSESQPPKTWLQSEPRNMAASMKP